MSISEFEICDLQNVTVLNCLIAEGETSHRTNEAEEKSFQEPSVATNSSLCSPEVFPAKNSRLIAGFALSMISSV